MLYQVMIRARAQRGYAGYVVWKPFAEPTRDPSAALQLVRQASQRRAEALVVQAEDADDLAELVRQMCADAPPNSTAPVEIAASTPRVPLARSTPHAEYATLAGELPAAWDDQRWKLERGAGGDHDMPYRFTLPASNRELHSWLRLMVRYHRATPADRES